MKTYKTFKSYEFMTIELTYGVDETPMGHEYAMLLGVTIHIDNGESFVINVNDSNREKFHELLRSTGAINGIDVYASYEDAVEAERLAYADELEQEWQGELA